jgi:hypothetical protein
MLVLRSPRAQADRSPRSTTIGSLIPLTVCTIVAAERGIEGCGVVADRVKPLIDRQKGLRV